MKPAVTRRDTCRLCGQLNPHLILSLEPTPPGDHYVTAERLDKPQATYPLDLVWCPNCNHFELADVVDPEILYGNYIYNTSISLGLVEHFQRYADAVLEKVNPPQGALVIDIGSNDGTLLKAFKRRGMQVLGIDPAGEVAKMAVAAGVETLVTFFNAGMAHEIKAKYGPVTIVTANNVFANIDNLTDMITGIRELLAPDGVFVFETGYMVDMVQQTIVDNVYHEHLSYYAVRPLAAFFKRNGMELIEIERVDTKGGSLRGVAQLAGGPRPTSPNLKTWTDYEINLGFHTDQPFRAFASRVAKVKSDLTHLLRDLKAQGMTVAGYGASVGVTTLIYYFGLNELVSFFIDDNPIRHNLYTPGHHMPVYASDVIYERKPDYVLVLAWRYFEPIRKRHQKYIEQGGHFILPLPEVEIR